MHYFALLTQCAYLSSQTDCNLSTPFCLLTSIGSQKLEKNSPYYPILLPFLKRWSTPICEGVIDWELQENISKKGTQQHSMHKLLRRKRDCPIKQNYRRTHPTILVNNVKKNWEILSWRVGEKPRIQLRGTIEFGSRTQQNARFSPTLVRLGAYIYDARCGWGEEGGPQKADEGNKFTWFVTVTRGGV